MLETLLEPENTPLLAGALVAVALAVVVYVLVVPYLSGGRQIQSRVAAATEARTARTARKTRVEQAQNRRRAIADTLKELEGKQKAEGKASLRVRLIRAGLDVTPKTFWIASMGTGFIVTAVVFAAVPSAPLPVFAVIAFAASLGLPRWYLSMATKSRQAKFTNSFADALDVIVRGAKSGLPFNECLNVIARESPEPIRGVFRDLVEQQRVGVSMADCLERAVEQMPTSEMKFFTIVVAIQQQAGGNLSEALGNLSGVIRARKQMAAKVKALAAEAKASAFVLGSLPFAVSGLIYVTSRPYLMVLVNTKVGNFMLICAGVWMLAGILLMRKMINFKF